MPVLIIILMTLKLSLKSVSAQVGFTVIGALISSVLMVLETVTEIESQTAEMTTKKVPEVPSLAVYLFCSTFTNAIDRLKSTSDCTAGETECPVTPVFDVNPVPG
eukprot:TRINITY_DN10095_c0_g1::TRINITY_DN10095_c0_g1_i1::g.21050::m.21050 TRINITY_DN10095_c0_g1::TRINITY_DN10095_c0_g1_i1::g.21050  ORF type:complete len:105 (-),score=-3.16,Pox_P21/PF05313.7/0.085 TRINITY_DN10095_c0_g1_i1:577-891(-)